MMRHNIYYTANIVSQTEESRAFGEQTVKLLEKHGNVLTTHVVRPDLKSWERENEANGVNICNRDLAWVNDSDVLVMDATWPMTGGGVELVHAAAIRSIPSLVVSSEGVRISPMVSQFTHPLVTKRTYQGVADLEKTIEAYFAELKHDFTRYDNLVIFDAIDGAGKGAIYATIKEWGQHKGLRLFDCVEYWKKINHLPNWDEVNRAVGGCQLLLTAEPTYEGVGKLIREEIVRKDNPRPWSSFSTAHAFSVNREALYKLLVKDALDAGALVASDRSVVTSQHYQVVQAEIEGYSPDHALCYVNGLPGNQYALKHIPGLLIFPKVSVDVTQARLAARADKIDSVGFEARSFQEALNAFYQSGRVKDYYRRRGTNVVDFDMAKCPTREDTKFEASAIFTAYLQEKNLKF
jgi:thymidylate kinase